MVQIIHRGKYRAKKRYTDDGYDLLSDSDIFIDAYQDASIQKKLSSDEYQLLIYYANNREAARSILPGQEYERQFNEYEGDTYVWRTKSLFLKIITTFGLFKDI